VQEVIIPNITFMNSRQVAWLLSKNQLSAR
jgi:hypothetical protein